MLFSKRHGITPPKQMQDCSMDAALRNGLWNALDTLLRQTPNSLDTFNQPQNPLYEIIWTDFFKKTRDTLPSTTSERHMLIRNKFFKMVWFSVYDLIEFICCPADKLEKLNGAFMRSNEIPIPSNSTVYLSEIHFKQFTKECNEVLEKEVSAWRIVGGKVCKITSEAETKAVEVAMQSPIEGVGQHITNSIILLYDRKSPDYKNAIKESISAVELICAKITKQNAPILSKALDKMKKDGIVNIHPALKAAFGNLYGYTSSGSGIRHAMIHDDEITFELAQFFLIACSAFTNYLITLAAKKKVNLE